MPTAPTEAELNEFLTRAVAEVIVKEALDTRKFKKPALLCDDTNYGQGGRAKMEKALEKRGVKAAYVGKFKIKDTDMTAQLQEAKAAGADVLLVYGIGPELAAVANSMSRIGWKVDMVGSWTLSMSAFIQNAGANGNGATMPQTFIEAAEHNAKQKKFVEDYQKKFNEKPISVAVAAAQGYDSMYLLKMAIQKAGSTEGPKVKAALEELGAYEGITGKYSKPFSKTDHEAVHDDDVVMGVVKDGKVMPPVASASPKKADATPTPAAPPTETAAANGGVDAAKADAKPAKKGKKAKKPAPKADAPK